MNAMLDTLKAAKAFEDAGFAKAQAETLAITIADAMNDTRQDLVTKDFLRGELATLRAELKGDIAGLRTELKGDIAGLRTELKGDIAGVRGEIAGVKNELIRWVLGSQVMLIVILVALSESTKLFD